MFVFGVLLAICVVAKIVAKKVAVRSNSLAEIMYYRACDLAFDLPPGAFGSGAQPHEPVPKLRPFLQITNRLERPGVSQMLAIHERARARADAVKTLSDVLSWLIPLFTFVGSLWYVVS
jgi:hypothetical protein